MRLIVSNTGPLLHLAEGGSLGLLGLAGEVHVPRQVVAELVSLEHMLPELPWIMVQDLESAPAHKALAWQQAGLLDAEEAEALALAQQLQADWFLTDDAAARLLASSLGLEVHGAVGIVLWAAALGHVDHAGAHEAPNRLAQSSLWISSRVLTEAQQAIERLFEN